jgi:tRNA/tmRNA/rRNA uracil-C5-methylase (TrmA/RlmC/RlmD family)
MWYLSWQSHIYIVLVMQVSVVNNVNTSVGNTSVGEQEYTLYGKPTITEMLRGLTFQISANSFFQTNTKQVCSYYINDESMHFFPVTII